MLNIFPFFQKKLFNRTEEAQIMTAIRAVERECSGEVRVYVETKSSIPTHERTLQVFKKLKMNRTRERNGVLIYVALGDRKFAVFGDEGIHEKMGSAFWESEAATLKKHFEKGEIIEGICAAIGEIGEVLKRYFPEKRTDDNQLPDTPVYGK